MEWVKRLGRYALTIGEFLVEDLALDHGKELLDEAQVLSKLICVDLSLARGRQQRLVVYDGVQLGLSNQLVVTQAESRLLGPLHSAGRLLAVDELFLLAGLFAG